MKLKYIIPPIALASYVIYKSFFDMNDIFNIHQQELTKQVKLQPLFTSFIPAGDLEKKIDEIDWELITG